jgi:predicted transcriptional regulator
MVSFIADHRDGHGVEPICRQLPIAPSTYYEQKAREADPDRLPDRMKRDQELEPEIQRAWNEHFQVYGARKVWRQLNREDFEVARCTVERLMKRLGRRGSLVEQRPGRRSVMIHWIAQRISSTGNLSRLARTSCGSRILPSVRPASEGGYGRCYRGNTERPEL